jgi:(2R)-sulfolactate sulfo-lyase subunit alpha
LSKSERTPHPAVRAPKDAAHFLVHKEGDHVAVAVQDVDPGPVRVAYMDTDRIVDMRSIEQIPLGHKMALIDLGASIDVIEYGVRVGLTRSAIKQGALVHVHNIRSAKWQKSV